MINEKIFNTSKTDYETPSLFFGQNNGLFDTVNKKFPRIWELYKTMKSLDWDENEFDYSSCLQEFKSCSPSTYEMMIKTLAWQWEADSVASRISPLVGCVVSSSELWAAWQRISDNEVTHAATYSEIVRNSFPDPSVIVSEVLKVEEAMSRLTTVAKVMANAHETAHRHALGEIDGQSQSDYNDIFMFVVAMLILERVQFMSSFAVTFAICDTGMFQPIGRAVQKIAQDELEVHVELDKAVIRNELKTERGKVAFEMCKPLIEELFDEVIDGELAWNGFLFSEGRELVGMNSEFLNNWTLFCGKDVVDFLKIDTKHRMVRTNPLKFMESWLNISKSQGSPQEEAVAQYKVNTMRRNDDGETFDVDF